MTQLRYKDGDVVFTNKENTPLLITAIHSGYYDYQYTGIRENGDIVYFNEEDVYDPDRQNS